MDETIGSTDEEAVKIKEEPIDFTEFVNSDENLVRVNVQLEEITKDDPELSSENVVVHVKIEEINEGEEIDNNSSEQLNEESTSSTINYKCVTCRKIFKTESALNKHECCICELCNKSFTHRSHLHIHYRSHTGEKPHKCGECGKNFSLKSNLKKHVKLHVAEKEFKCDECGKEFTQSKGLASHYRNIHSSDDKPCVCEFCGKRFMFPTQLRVHVRIHSGEKPFPCKLCDKKFSDPSNLRTHMFNVHNEEGTKTTFKCISCNKVFTSESGLKKHSCLICEFCGKYFSKSNDFRRHVGTHSGEKPFECKDCGNKYSGNYYLKKHMKSHQCDQSFEHDESLQENQDHGSTGGAKLAQEGGDGSSSPGVGV